MTLDRLRALVDVIETCGKCGDCGTDGTQATTAKRHVDRPCVVTNVMGFEAYDARGRILVSKRLLDGSLPVSSDLLEWLHSCTGCGSCKETCLAIDGGIDTPVIMEALRADIVDAGVIVPKHGDLAASIATHGNPYGAPRDQRAVIVTGRPLDPSTGTLLFLGCTASCREQSVATSVMDLFEALGIGYTVLGDEGCCGSVLKRFGHLDAFQSNARKMIAAIVASGASRILFTCAGCYRTFKKDYEAFGGAGVECLHVSEFLEAWLRERAGSFKFKFKTHARMTYHDPCHLGRHLGVYEAPRVLLKAIDNATLVEMDTARNFSHCCGAGGGVKSSNPEMARSIGTNRIEDAKAKGAEILVSACPFCEKNLKDGAGADGMVVVHDIVEVMLETLARDMNATVSGCASAGATTIGTGYMDYLTRYPEIFSDLVAGSVMDFTIYESIDDLENECDPLDAFHVTRTGSGIAITHGRADSPDLQLALSTRAVERLTVAPTKETYASLFGTFYNDPDEEQGWIDFVLHKRTKTLIKMGYGKFAEAAGILEDEDAA